LSLCRFTASPPEGAGAVSVTVPVILLPPVATFADRLTDATQGGGVTVSVADAPAQPFTLELIVADVLPDPELVDTLKLAEVCPAGTVTVAATWTRALLLARLTTSPPAGAADVRVTVPVTLPPPVTVLFDKLTDATQGGGVTVTVADAPAQPFRLAVIVADVELDPALVVTLKLAEVCPAGMVTVAAT